MVDVAIMSPKERFTTLGKVTEMFGVLVTSCNMTNEELMQQCEALSSTFSYGGQSDKDGKKLAKEMRRFSDLPSTNMTPMEVLDFLHEGQP